MTAYTAETLDLSRIGAPNLVPADYDAILRARLAHLAALWKAEQAKDPTLPDIDPLDIKSSVSVILSEAAAFADTLVRQAINDAANSLRLAKAVGPDLEHVTTSSYLPTQRQLLVPADPSRNIAAVYESDDELRARAQLAPEAVAAYGLTPGGYIYKVRTAFADRVKAVTAINRGAGLVELRILGRTGDGSVSPSLLAEVAGAFAGEDASQSTDILTVLAAEIVPWSADVTLVMPRGPDPEMVTAAARANLIALGESLHRLGAGLYREAVASAAHLPLLYTVRVQRPGADSAGRPEAAPYLNPDHITISTEIL